MNNLKPRLTYLNIIKNAERKLTPEQREEHQFVVEALFRHQQRDQTLYEHQRLWKGIKSALVFAIGVCLVIAGACWLILR
jgi:hypothetical protein